MPAEAGAADKGQGEKEGLGAQSLGQRPWWDYILSSPGLWDNESEPLMEKCLSVYKGLLASFMQSFLCNVYFPQNVYFNPNEKVVKS